MKRAVFFVFYFCLGISLLYVVAANFVQDRIDLNERKYAEATVEAKLDRYGVDCSTTSSQKGWVEVYRIKVSRGRNEKADRNRHLSIGD